MLQRRIAQIQYRRQDQCRAAILQQIGKAEYITGVAVNKEQIQHRRQPDIGQSSDCCALDPQSRHGGQQPVENDFERRSQSHGDQRNAGAAESLQYAGRYLVQPQ